MRVWTTRAAPAGRVSDAIGAITQIMRSCELSPGDRLPSEAHLAKELSVSRSVVREAMSSLAALRLVDLQVGRRAVVAGLDYAAMLPIIEHGVLTDQFSVLQIYDVRRTIETRTAELAALRATPEEVAALRARTAAMRAFVEAPEQLMAEDLAFHREIASASRNPVFALIIGAFESVTRQTWPIGWRSRSTTEEQLGMIDIHDEVADAIGNGDPAGAREAMARHFDQSVRALIAAGL